MVSIPSYNTHIATYDPIATTTLGSASTNVTFSGIGADWTDLVLVCDYSTTATNSLYFRMGATSVDTGTNYSDTNLIGNGSSVASTRHSNNGSVLISNANSRGIGNRNITILHFLSYANTNVYKTVLQASSSPSVDVFRTVGLWRSTAAIDIISLLTSGGYSAGSKFSLYGIRGEL